MGVFTFVCRSSGGKWTANQYSGDLEGSADSTYELQRKLVQSALSVDSSGGVQSSFSLITPTSAVFQVFTVFSVILVFHSSRSDAFTLQFFIINSPTQCLFDCLAWLVIFLSVWIGSIFFFPVVFTSFVYVWSLCWCFNNYDYGFWVHDRLSSFWLREFSNYMVL